MEYLGDILKVLLLVVTGIFGNKVWNWRLDQKKLSAETGKITADTHKTNAETEGIAVTSLSTVVKQQAEELKRLSGAVDEIEADRKQCDERYDLLHAEFDNFRKESAKEFDDFRKESAKQLKTITTLQTIIKKVKSEKADLDKKLKVMEGENSKLILRVIELEKHEVK